MSTVISPTETRVNSVMIMIVVEFIEDQMTKDQMTSGKMTIEK